MEVDAIISFDGTHLDSIIKRVEHTLIHLVGLSGAREILPFWAGWGQCNFIQLQLLSFLLGKRDVIIKNFKDKGLF